MKTRMTIVAVLALAVGALGCESRRTAENKYCASLTSLDQGLKKLDAMGPSTTTAELSRVANQLQKDVDNVAREARHISSPAAKQLTDAAERLDLDTRSIPGSATIGEVQAKILSDSAEVKRRAQTLAGQSGCPNVLQG
jgi:hypothetical protein